MLGKYLLYFAVRELYHMMLLLMFQRSPALKMIVLYYLDTCVMLFDDVCNVMFTKQSFEFFCFVFSSVKIKK